MLPTVAPPTPLIIGQHIKLPCCPRCTSSSSLSFFPSSLQCICINYIPLIYSTKPYSTLPSQSLYVLTRLQSSSSPSQVPIKYYHRHPSTRRSGAMSSSSNVLHNHDQSHSGNYLNSMGRCSFSSSCQPSHPPS